MKINFRKYLSVFFLLVAATLAAHFLLGLRPKPLEIHVINVGDADSIMIRAPGGETALVDAGRKESAPEIVDYLQAQKIKNLQYLILTHYHDDHIGGVPLIQKEFAIGTIYDNGQDLTPFYPSAFGSLMRHYQTAVRERSRYGILRAGDRLWLGKIAMDIFWPLSGDLLSRDFNLNSMVIRISYGKSKMLLVGDLLAPSEYELISQGKDLQADILKVGHHGSQYATSEDFLNKVRAKVAVISLASNEPGVPSREVLERLSKRGIKIYRTDEQGSIRILIAPNGSWTIKTEE